MSDDLEQFADEHGLPALLDHIGLDEWGNRSNAAIAALKLYLTELDDAQARSECGECPPTVATETIMRKALADLTVGAKP